MEVAPRNPLSKAEKSELIKFSIHRRKLKLEQKQNSTLQNEAIVMCHF